MRGKTEDRRPKTEDRRRKTEVKPLIIHQLDPKITKKPTTSPSEGSSKNCPVPCAPPTLPCGQLRWTKPEHCASSRRVPHAAFFPALHLRFPAVSFGGQSLSPGLPPAAYRMPPSSPLPQKKSPEESAQLPGTRIRATHLLTRGRFQAHVADMQRAVPARIEMENPEILSILFFGDITPYNSTKPDVVALRL